MINGQKDLEGRQFPRFNPLTCIQRLSRCPIIEARNSRSHDAGISRGPSRFPGKPSAVQEGRIGAGRNQEYSGVTQFSGGTWLNTQEKVLIVEDEENERSGLSELVSAWGFRVETARDGAEGLEKAIQWTPSIVI